MKVGLSVANVQYVHFVATNCSTHLITDVMYFDVADGFS